jgi:hypothetical protein
MDTLPAITTSQEFITRLAEQNLVDLARVQSIIEAFNDRISCMPGADDKLISQPFTGETGVALNYHESILDQATGLPSNATVLYLAHLFKQAGWQLEVKPVAAGPMAGWKMADRTRIKELIWRVWFIDTTVSPNHLNLT